MEKYKAVLFDMDGVIIDTEKHLVKYWCEAANEMGYPMKREHALHIRSLSGNLAAEYLKKEVDSGFDYERVRERRKELMSAELKRVDIEMKRGIKELLSELKKRGIRRAVCTATDYPRTKGYLTEIGLFDSFDKIICASMVKHGKPAPDIYLYACGELSLDPAECLAAEDSPNGILSAYSAGCSVVMIPDLTPPTEEDRSRIIGAAETLIDVVKYL